jgi:hypothetical protein
MINFYFNLIFFSIAPLQQIAANWVQFYGIGDSAAYGAFLSLCVVGLGWAAFALRGRPFRRVRNTATVFQRSIHSRAGSVLLLMTIMAVAISVAIVLYGGALLTSREARGALISDTLNRQVAIFLYAYCQPLLVIGSVIGCIVSIKRGNLLGTLIFLTLVAGAFLVNNPLITARFRLGTLAVFCMLCFVGWNNTRVLLNFSILSLLVSPILNTLRFERTIVDPRTFFGFFAHADYDAFSIICRCIDYVATSGFSNGTNLLSAVFFFVPRSIWENKSEHMTKIMFDYLHEKVLAQTDNLSSPPVAEGYFAFGFIGAMIICALVLGVALLIERRAAASQGASTWHFIACLAPILFLITLRGPLIVGISESCGNLAALLTAIGLTGAFLPSWQSTRKLKRNFNRK